MVKVLVPLDGSERSLAAAEKGLRVLKAAKPDVTLLCVQHKGFKDAPEDVVEMFDDDEDDEIFPTKDSAQRMLDDAAARMKKAGVTCQTKVAHGNVRKEILKAAKGCDVLLMHALNKGGFGEKLKMSGTESIARKAECSVFLVED